MDSQKTTHILLVIIAVGIFFMIFLFVKERYLNDSARISHEKIDVVVQDTVKPVESNPKKLAVNIGDISKGDKVKLSYINSGYSDLASNDWVFCNKDAEKDYLWFFSDNANNCGNLENQVWVKTDALDVKLKENVNINVLYELNRQYNIAIADIGNNPTDRGRGLILQAPDHYNAISIARIYFETGYFDKVEVVAGFWTN